MTRSLTITAAQDGGFYVTDPATPMGQVSTIKLAGPLAVCLAYVEEAMAPPRPLVAEGSISADELAEVMRAGPGPVIQAPNKAEMAALAEALELYQRGGHMAGVQVIGARVVVWIGDPLEGMVSTNSVYPWLGQKQSQRTVFHSSLGPDAIAQAAKWLLDQWDPTHG